MGTWTKVLPTLFEQLPHTFYQTLLFPWSKLDFSQPNQVQSYVVSC